MTWAWDQSVKPASAKLVLLCLANAHNSKTEKCFPSIAVIAERSGLDRKAVMSGLKKLESLRLILIQKKFGASNSYQLLTSTENCTGSNERKEAQSSAETGTSTDIGTSAESGTPPVPKPVLEPVPKTGHKPVIEPVSNQKQYVFEGDRVRINQKDFDLMQSQYSNLDLMAQLPQLDLELRGEKKWWPALQAKLNYRNRQHANSAGSHGGAQSRKQTTADRLREQAASL